MHLSRFEKWVWTRVHRGCHACTLGEEEGEKISVIFKKGQKIKAPEVYMRKQSYGYTGFQDATSPKARHLAKANVVFCDGHVESPTLKSLFEDTTDAALVRWNRDHLPHRELLQP